MTEIDHHFRLVETGEPCTQMFACVYAGNSANKGVCWPSLKLTFNYENGCWQDEKAIVQIPIDGRPSKIILGPGPEDFLYGMYCSPIEDDVTRFVVAYNQAIVMVNDIYQSPRNKPKQVYVAGVGTNQNGEIAVMGEEPIRFDLNDDGKYKNEFLTFEVLEYGFTHLDQKISDDNSFNGQIFSSPKYNQVWHYLSGCMSVINNVKLKRD